MKILIWKNYNMKNVKNSEDNIDIKNSVPQTKKLLLLFVPGDHQNAGSV